jgi:hypothetical protein
MAAVPTTAVTYRRAARVSCFTQFHHVGRRGCLARASWMLPVPLVEQSQRQLSECATPCRQRRTATTTRAAQAGRASTRNVRRAFGGYRIARRCA